MSQIRLTLIISTLMIMVIASAVLADTPENLQKNTEINIGIDVPPMVADLYEKIGDPETLYRYSEAFGWGTGTLKSGSKSFDFVWVAWINSDMYLQFQFSLALGDVHFQEIATITDSLDRPWDSHYDPSSGFTWIGTSNDGGLSRTNQHQWLEATVSRFNDLSFIGSMSTVNFLY